MTQPVAIPAAGVTLPGDLVIPPDARGIVVFAHGSGSSRHSPRNRSVADELQRAGCATLLFDLLTESEASRRALVFDIGLLALRLRECVAWLRAQAGVSELPVGLFGASTGAAAALVAAAEEGEGVRAVVSRGGRPDLAAEYLPRVTAATLLIVGGDDTEVIELNVSAFQLLRCMKQLEIVPGASHLFEEPGALEKVAALAAEWFARYLGGRLR
jgi:putative phosphoribosyl transferase